MSDTSIIRALRYRPKEPRPILVWIIFFVYVGLECWSLWYFYQLWNHNLPLPDRILAHTTSVPYFTIGVSAVLSIGLLIGALLLLFMRRASLYIFAFYFLFFLAATITYLVSGRTDTIVLTFGPFWLVFSVFIKGLTLLYIYVLDLRDKLE